MYLLAVTAVIVIVIAVLIILVGLYFLITYNKFVSLRNSADEALSSIDVQLKRRYDLIPNLVETVRGYATHEKSTFEEVTQARAAAMGAPSATENPAAAAAAESALSGALGRMMLVAEQYPNLRATENFQQLQQELTATEDKVAASRAYYNRVVLGLNTKVQQFPSSVVANAGGIKAREFFEIEDSSTASAATQREAVQVKF